MDFEEAKAVLRDGYVAAGLEVVDEHPAEIFLRYHDAEFRICEEDIYEYADSEGSRSTLEAIPVECSICGPSYREQMVQPLDPRRAFLYRTARGPYVFGDPSGDATYVEIGPASMRFANHFRVDEVYLELSLERMRRPYLRGGTESGPMDMRDYLYMPPTVRVHNMAESTTASAVERSSALIEACLFELSYLRRITFGLVEEWPTRMRRARRRPFEFGEPFRGEAFPLPVASFNPDIVRFYRLGMSSEEPVLQFLAFYQVLEYFFVTVSDERLYDKLSRRFNDPKFRTTPRQLDRVIQDVLGHSHTTDETAMLGNVLETFVDQTELIEFVKAYEEHLNDARYTKRRSVFGEDIEVKLRPGHVIPNISTRIKAVRNALVHSSDRWERRARYIPFSKTTDIVRLEVPLVKFLAERVIIASAT